MEYEKIPDSCSCCDAIDDLTDVSPSVRFRIINENGVSQYVCVACAAELGIKEAQELLAEFSER